MWGLRETILDITNIGSIESVLTIIEMYIYNDYALEDEFIYRNLDLLNFFLIGGHTYKPETLEDHTFKISESPNDAHYIIFTGPIVNGYVTTSLSWNIKNNALYFEFDQSRRNQMINFILSIIPNIDVEDFMTNRNLRFEIINKEYVEEILRQLYLFDKINPTNKKYLETIFLKYHIMSNR